MIIFFLVYNINYVKGESIKILPTNSTQDEQIIKNNQDLLKANPHTSIYKILDAIYEFNKKN